MWRRPRMLSTSGGATSDAILAVFGSIRTPTVRIAVVKPRPTRLRRSRSRTHLPEFLAQNVGEQHSLLVFTPLGQRQDFRRARTFSRLDCRIVAHHYMSS